MDGPVLLQTGPETFQVMLGHGRRVAARLAHHTRRGLGLQGVPPLTVATEIVAFLLERETIDTEQGDELELGAAAGRYPEFVDELRSRLS